MWQKAFQSFLSDEDERSLLTASGSAGLLFSIDSKNADTKCWTVVTAKIKVALAFDGHLSIHTKHDVELYTSSIVL